jgi:hypothetical protein
MRQLVPVLDGRPVGPGSTIEFMAPHAFESNGSPGKVRPGSQFVVEGVDDTDYSDPMWGDKRDETDGPARLLIRAPVGGATKVVDVPCDPAIIRLVAVLSTSQP